MAHVWMEVTFVALFSQPTASRYRSADLRFKTRMAQRSVNVNFPVASTEKSLHCPTMTAALPSPKWPRSKRFAAASQSGTAAAWTANGLARQTAKSSPRTGPAAAKTLLPLKNHNFLVIFGNLIEELFGIEILNIRLQKRFFQIVRSRAGHRVPILRAGMRKSTEIVFHFHIFGQLLDLDFRRQLPGAGAHALFRVVEFHRGMPRHGLKQRALILIVHPRIQQ